MNGYGRRILLIHEDGPIRMFWSLVLQYGGYTVVEAAELQQGLGELSRRAFNGVLDLRPDEDRTVHTACVIMARYPGLPVMTMQEQAPALRNGDLASLISKPRDVARVLVMVDEVATEREPSAVRKGAMSREQSDHTGSFARASRKHAVSAVGKRLT